MAITLPQMMRGRWMAALFAGTAMMAAGSLGTQTEQNFDGEVPQAIHLEYLLFLPSTSNEDLHRRWPLILYLHGGSLRGDDVNKLRTLGLPHRLEQDRQFPTALSTGRNLDRCGCPRAIGRSGGSHKSYR